MYYVIAAFVAILFVILYKRALISYHIGLIDDSIKNKAFDNMKLDFSFSSLHAAAASIGVGVFIFATGDKIGSSNFLNSILWLCSFAIIAVYFECNGYLDQFKYHAERCYKFKTNFNEHNGNVLVQLATKYCHSGPDKYVLYASKIVVSPHKGRLISTEYRLGDYFVKTKDGVFPTSEEIQTALKSILEDVNEGFGFTIINPNKHTFDGQVALQPFVGTPSNPSQILVEVKNDSNS